MTEKEKDKKAEDIRLRRLRNRVTYRRWSETYDKFRELGMSHNKAKKSCRITWWNIEQFSGHGSGMAAGYSRESMEQVFIDKKSGKVS